MFRTEARLRSAPADTSHDDGFGENRRLYHPTADVMEALGSRDLKGPYRGRDYKPDTISSFFSSYRRKILQGQLAKADLTNSAYRNNFAAFRELARYGRSDFKVLGKLEQQAYERAGLYNDAPPRHTSRPKESQLLQWQEAAAFVGGGTNGLKMFLERNLQELETAANRRWRQINVLERGAFLASHSDLRPLADAFDRGVTAVNCYNSRISLGKWRAVLAALAASGSLDGLLRAVRVVTGGGVLEINARVRNMASEPAAADARARDLNPAPLPADAFEPGPSGTSLGRQRATNAPPSGTAHPLLLLPQGHRVSPLHAAGASVTSVPSPYQAAAQDAHELSESRQPGIQAPQDRQSAASSGSSAAPTNVSAPSLLSRVANLGVLSSQQHERRELVTPRVVAPSVMEPLTGQQDSRTPQSASAVTPPTLTERTALPPGTMILEIGNVKATIATDIEPALLSALVASLLGGAS